MIRKFQLYDEHGVEEFYLYDPESGSLEGWLRGALGLDDVADMNGHISPKLAVRFEPGEGPDNLKIFGPDGRRFLTYVELFEEREAEQQRADAEHQRADAEIQRADAEHRRAERLAARLREMGEVPD